jgi:hypothetical protein
MLVVRLAQVGGQVIDHANDGLADIVVRAQQKLDSVAYRGVGFPHRFDRKLLLAVGKVEVERAARRSACRAGYPPMGALGLRPQKICDPIMPIRCTSTMFRIIDFAVALPTPTGPPEAV